MHTTEPTPHAHTNGSGTKTSPRGGPLPRSLDELARLACAELEALYRKAPSAVSLRAIDGKPKGRMLAVRNLEATPIGAFARAFAGSKHFIWDGKTFTSSSDQKGSGINRLQVPGALGRQNLFPFETSFGPSAIDGGPTLVLDYDLPENPPWIRKIHDEVREVSPGLFLGPAMWKARSGRVTLLWFALDTRGA